MKKNVLVPTDFSIESLNVVKSFLGAEQGECAYNILLVHGVRLSDSITDMLFFSRMSLIEALRPQSFEEACRVIKNKYASQVTAIRSDIFTGTTQAAFNNYLQGNRIQEIYVPSTYTLTLKDQRSFDIMPFITNCKRNIIPVDWNMEVVLPEKGELAEIFYNEASVG